MALQIWSSAGSLSLRCSCVEGEMHVILALGCQSAVIA